MTQTNPPNIPPLPSPTAPPLHPAAQASPPPTHYAPTQDERTMAMLIWLLGLLSGWLGPLIIWLIKREQSKFIDFHGKQSLYLHIAAMVLIVPMIILTMIPFVGCLIFLLI